MKQFENNYKGESASYGRSLLPYFVKGGDYMKGGFSFCGIDIEDIGLNYAPENKDTYVYAPGIENVHEETFEGHNGGYAYGAYKEPKEIILRCYYEEEHIAKGLMAKARALFKVGKSGLLVFKRRPWCYYYATVTNVNADDVYSYLNGLFVVTMKAYYPYARGIEVNGHMFYNLTTDPYHGEIMANTGLFDKEFFVPQMSFENITGSTNIILYNPGTERANVSLVISGHSEDGVTIYNKTTEQTCRYVAFDTKNNEYVYTDGITGKTVADEGVAPFVPTNARRLAFLYHDYGYIDLEPAFPIIRDMFVQYGGSTVHTVNLLYNTGEDYKKEFYKDKYIYLDGWYKIMECTGKQTLTIYPSNGQYPESGSIKTNIVTMNELTITPSQGTVITRLNFIYKPTYS